MNEIWKPIKNFESCYAVSNLGNVKSLERTIMNRGKPYRKKERLLKLNLDARGYYSVVLCKEGKIFPRLVHRLVAEAFIDNPDNKPVVDHKDTNTQNNKAENLRWVTTQENCMNPITRVNNSNSKKGHPCYLKSHSEETKRKLSEMKKGIALTEEHKKKLSDAKKKYYAERRKYALEKLGL